MKFGLTDEIIAGIEQVFETNSKVDKAIIFGSRAKGNFREGSDIDIAIKGKELSFKDIISLSGKLEDLELPYKIDLIDYTSIKEPALQEHIDRVGIEFYSRWKQIPLSKTTKFIVDNRGKTVPTATEGIPLIATNCINNTNLYPVYENLRYISQQTYDTWFRSHPEPGDIILTLKGSQNGAVCLVPNPVGFVIAQDMVALRVNEKIIDPHFLFAALRSSEIQSEIKNLDVSGVIPHLKKSDFDKLILPYPDMETQKTIGDIYFNLSNKIDLLQRQNKTLEQLAETLFRSYFPTTNDFTQLVELGEYVDCINGVSYKSSELNPSNIGMVSLKSFDRNGGFGIDGFKEFTGKFKEKQIVVEGDLIVAHTDITQDAEVIGNPALVISNPNFDTMVISMDIVKVNSKVDWVSTEFLYFLMKTREFKSHCEGCANGSTVLHLNKQAIPTFEFPKPDKDKVLEFSELTKGFLSKIFLNHKQLRTLSQTRDTLLPKLMSGEVRVKMSEHD
jgi:type I restriction enzyme, S subunit